MSRSCVGALALALFSFGLLGFAIGYQVGEARGYESGISDARAWNAPRPTIEIAPEPIPTPLPTWAVCEPLLADYRRTEAANRANARAQGLNEGLRIGREDWYSCGAWEAERLR